MPSPEMHDAQKHNHEKGQYPHADNRTAQELDPFQAQRPPGRLEAVAIARHVNPVGRIKISLESRGSLMAIFRPALHCMQNDFLRLG